MCRCWPIRCSGFSSTSHQPATNISNPAVNALRHFINPLMKWTLASEGPGILTKDIVSSLVADVFQTPDQGRWGV